MKEVESYIKSIPDFPEKGIIFRDITTVLQSPEGFGNAIDDYIESLEKYDFDVVIGLESRGFIFGTPIAYQLKKAFVPIRKKGKLPRETISQKYDLEYGSAEIEIHKDALEKGQKVIIVDDLLATGGTIEAAVNLVEKLGAQVVACAFLVELKGLNGRERIKKYNVESIVSYEGK